MILDAVNISEKRRQWKMNDENKQIQLMQTVVVEKGGMGRIMLIVMLNTRHAFKSTALGSLQCIR